MRATNREYVFFPDDKLERKGRKKIAVCRPLRQMNGMIDWMTSLYSFKHEHVYIFHVNFWRIILPRHRLCWT